MLALTEQSDGIGGRYGLPVGLITADCLNLWVLIPLGVVYQDVLHVRYLHTVYNSSKIIVTKWQ